MTGRQTKKPDLACRIRARFACTAAILLCTASLITVSAYAAPPAPVRLAIFDFELEDGSAAAFATEPADLRWVTQVTTDVRDLFAQSGRYLPVDVSGADAAAARGHTLHACDGCDAAIALKLGAEQSFVGVVKRITRTEYVIRFQIRDARTGTVVSAGTSGLRMGADYSWSRGAVRLIKDQLLDVQDQR